MKIAVASDQKKVSGHFGHCQGYWLFDADQGQMTGEQYVENPGHKPGYLPGFLKEKGVSVIISGGMGARAIQLFNEQDIEVITGASGDVRQTVKQYLEGALQSSGSVCHQHEHHDTCGEE